MKAAGWLVVVALFSAVLLPCHGAGHVRVRRTASQFGKMIRAATRSKSLSDINRYGNYCGVLGSGEPVDNIDRCCRDHDLCLRAVNRRACLPLFYVAFFVIPYRWSYVDNQLIYCSERNSGCQFALCECDRKAAGCLAQYEDDYNSVFFKKSVIG